MVMVVVVVGPNLLVVVPGLIRIELVVERMVARRLAPLCLDSSCWSEIFLGVDKSRVTRNID